jgi:hypothetical protein
MRVVPTSSRARVYNPKTAHVAVAKAKLNLNPRNLLVTPRYDEFLVQNPDVTISKKHAQRIADLISTPQRDRSRSFSASSSGMCMRRQELAFLGVKGKGILDPRTIRIFNNGTWFHLRTQAAMLEARILDAVEVTVKMNRGLARATLDGIGEAQEGRWNGASFFAEFKGRNWRSFDAQDKNNTPDNKTLQQVGFQFWVTGFEVGVVLNEDKNDQRLREWVVEYSQEHADAAKNEVKAMTDAVNRSTLHKMLPECIRRLRGGEYYKCPFGGDMGACVNSGSWPSGI